MYAFSYFVPSGLGGWDYAINSTLALVIYAAAFNVWHLKVAQYVFRLELLAAIMAGLAWWDGYVSYIGPFFDHYDTILGVINSLELFVLVKGIPWSAIFNGIHGFIERLRPSGFANTESSYRRENVNVQDIRQEA